jgi:hypothetical protein
MRPDGTQNIRTMAILGHMQRHNRKCPNFEAISEPLMRQCRCGISTEVSCGVCGELLVTLCKPGHQPCACVQPGEMV